MTTANLPIAQQAAHLLCPTAHPIVRSTALALIGVVLLAVSAKIQIPFYPVPQTLQTMIVLLVGMTYGGTLGVVTVSLYLVVGAMGLPIFDGSPEKGIGLAYMRGPMGGYLLGFIFATAVCGMLARHGWDKNVWTVGLAMISGNIIIYTFNLLWLGNLIGCDKLVLQLSMLNFLLGDVVKIIFVAIALPPIVKAIRRGEVMNKNSSSIQEYETIRIVLLWSIGILFAIFISVMLFPCIECIFSSLTGVRPKSELLKFIGWGISGLIATLGVIGLLQRAAALDEQNKLTEKGHIHERFKAATKHLGNKESISVRIASFNEFYRLAEIANKIPEEKGLEKTIFNILCAHLRETTKQQSYTDNIKPTEEIQSLLDILFKQENKDIFSGLNANVAEIHLQGADLQGADLRGDLQGAKLQMANLQRAMLQGARLQGARLQLADLREAMLRGADLQGARLQGAYLRKANLQEVMLRRAKLRGAMLQLADLREAMLRGAELQGAKLQWAKLQGADLREVNLQKANLRRANLRRANLRRAKLREADLQWTELQEANLQWAELQEVNLREANLREAELQGAKLQLADLRGADMQGVKVDNITMKYMPDNWKNVVKQYKGEEGKEKTGALLVDGKGTVIKYL